NNSVFSGLCAAASEHRVEVDSRNAGVPDDTITGRLVSGNYFSVLGLKAAAGRLLADVDDTAESANPVVVLGFDYWQRKFGGTPAILGKDIRLNGYPFTVVGVAPAGFNGDVVGEQLSVFVPLSMQPQIIRGRHWRNSPTSSWLSLIGRLKPGFTPANAESNLNIVFQQAMRGSYGATLSSDDRNLIRNAHINVSVGGNGLSDLRADYRTPLLILMGIVGLVLLIACVNVANLLFARSSSRKREIAMRLALGANRRRLLQQLLTESVLLALLGAVAGSLLAIWGVRLLVGLLGSQTALPLSPDWHVLAFTLVVSSLTGILFGMLPALQTLRVRVSPSLKDGARTVPGPSARLTWGKGLIAGQVALSLLVLFAAGLLVRSLKKLMAQDFGYEHEHLLIARLDPAAGGYSRDKVKQLAQQLATRLASTPGVRAATYSMNGLFAGTESDDEILIPGFVPSSDRDRVAAEDYVGPDYFAAIGIPILSGRGIELQDTATSPRVAVVNEAMVKHFFAGGNPVGRQFRINDPDWIDKPITIIGVSRGAKDQGRGLRGPVAPRFYLAFQQVPDPPQLALEMRVTGVASAALSSMTSQIKAVDPQLPIAFVQTLERRIAAGAANQIALAKLSSFFAGLALLLACVGLYGVMSYTVAGRTREIGVRMALGAERQQVLISVLREGMLLVALGVLIGTPLALISSRALHSFLYGLDGTDPVSMMSVVLLLAAVSAAAGFIPARRASNVDPMVALRYE
ncbi:MAG TPA: ABC transporter permease, partial [Terriglobales bacterium]|nr:ABC transporter permease [Terriglobales bacterium]